MTRTYALLLTDVVDSTAMAERLGDAAMAEVWAAHDRAARDLLPQHGGREIDKTDGMLLLFADAAPAVAYAEAYQAALQRLPVPLAARAGLHVGPVVLRENTADDVARGAKPLEVDGLAKPTAARVMALARGGQLLLSPEARQALQEGGHDRLCHSHGHWALKGVSEPIELFEPARGDTPPAPLADGDKAYRVVQQQGRWLPAREIPNKLPAQATRFVGREEELAALRRHLRQARLVTLLGMGGLGKTRLSLQAAAEALAEFPDGAWFLDLSPLREPALVVAEALSVLGLRAEPGQTPMQALLAHVAERRLLLVLDNCEHLIQPAAELAHALLRGAPQVRLLASSREALRVPGEQVLPVLPLPTPRVGDGLAALAASTAVRLFVERAQAHKPGFALNAAEAPAIAELVSRLEGIPLALELAAARVRALPVAEINKRLADRFKVLTGGSRVLQERQQTLRALVDWSYDLLQPAEQQLFARLAAFAGGFDLAAAEAVCGAEPLDPFDVLDLLGSLVEKSLVALDERGEAPRYRIVLQTLREYAQEKLRAQGDAEATAARHAEHYFGVAKQIRDGLRGAEPARWLAVAEAELDNCRAATATARAGAGVDVAIAIKLPMALQTFWLQRGRVSEAREMVQAALALPGIQQADRSQAWALYFGAVLASAQHDLPAARQWLSDGVVVMRRLGNDVEIAATLSTLAVVQSQGGDFAAAQASEGEALAIFERLADEACQGISHLHLGQFAAAAGEAERAQAALQRALALAQRTGHRETEVDSLYELGLLAFEQADAAGAGHHWQAALAASEATGHRVGQALARWGLVRLALQQRGPGPAEAAVGPPEAAHEAWRTDLAQALAVFAEAELRGPLLGALDSVALAAWQHALPAPGATPAAGLTLAAAVDDWRRQWALPRRPGSAAPWARARAAAALGLAPDDVVALENAGRSWGWQAALAQAHGWLEPTAG